MEGHDQDQGSALPSILLATGRISWCDLIVKSNYRRWRRLCLFYWPFKRQIQIVRIDYILCTIGML